MMNHVNDKVISVVSTHGYYAPHDIARNSWKQVIWGEGEREGILRCV